MAAKPMVAGCHESGIPRGSLDDVFTLNLDVIKMAGSDHTRLELLTRPSNAPSEVLLGVESGACH